MNATVKVIRREDVGRVLDGQRDKRIVFTNGCFDILHVGHARYLEQARALGDILVVGVNSDRSVREIKGKSRPLVPESERAELLAHLESVDFVTVFDESRPDALIEVVKPAIHIKGGDYREEDLPEADVVRKHGGRVIILPLVPGKSSTNVIQRVLDVYGTHAGNPESA